MQASYGRIDAEEADALAVAITWRAGFDPLRGADFFTRGARKAPGAHERTKQTLSKLQSAFERARAACQTRVNAINQVRGRGQRVRPQYINQTNLICQDAEQKKLAYLQMSGDYSFAVAQRKLTGIYNTHPASQSKVAAVAALTDYVHGRRGLASLQQYTQNYRVMMALKQTKSVLLEGPNRTTVRPQMRTEQPRSGGKSLAEELRQLKSALDQGLTTQEEYRVMRQQIMSRF